MKTTTVSMLTSCPRHCINFVIREIVMPFPAGILELRNATFRICNNKMVDCFNAPRSLILILATRIFSRVSAQLLVPIGGFAPQPFQQQGARPFMDVIPPAREWFHKGKTRQFGHQRLRLLQRLVEQRRQHRRVEPVRHRRRPHRLAQRRRQPVQAELQHRPFALGLALRRLQPRQNIATHASALRRGRRCKIFKMASGRPSSA